MKVRFNEIHRVLANKKKSRHFSNNPHTCDLCDLSVILFLRLRPWDMGWTVFTTLWERLQVQVHQLWQRLPTWLKRTMHHALCARSLLQKGLISHWGTEYPIDEFIFWFLILDLKINTENFILFNFCSFLGFTFENKPFYTMAQQSLKSFDRPLMGVYFSNSIIGLGDLGVT